MRIPITVEVLGLETERLILLQSIIREELKSRCYFESDEIDRLRTLLERAVFILTEIDGAYGFCRDARAALQKAESSPDAETKR